MVGRKHRLLWTKKQVITDLRSVFHV
uniref:Uncharacterized protein n=1 Tax=Anguilla anguilla TaxID=7936 RepID=A0A0E9SX80_ANGAN